jgi:hypothetical protein
MQFLGLTQIQMGTTKSIFYGQFILDEFSLNDVKETTVEKQVYQLEASNIMSDVENLVVQLEYNHVIGHMFILIQLQTTHTTIKV